MKQSQWLLGLAIASTLSAPALAQDVNFSGDLRVGYAGYERDERDGSHEDDGQFRLRARAGVQWDISETYSVKARYAARLFHKDNESLEFKLYDSMPSRSEGSLRPGQSTLDELYIRARYGRWQHIVGRFQYSDKLVGPAAKSFSRTNSTSFDVNWTDGLYSRYQFDNDWNLNFILEHNSKDGSTHLRRLPLNFQDKDSRLTYYASLTKSEPEGFWLQRAVDVTVMPQALYHHGVSSAAHRDYVGFTGRVAVQQPLVDSMKFMAGAELGWAPETPSKQAMNLPGSGDSGGSAFQVSLNLLDIRPGHSLSFVHGETDAGWLLSTDFVNNASLTELRYSWATMPGHLFQARLRKRRDLEEQIGAVRKRGQTDFWVRYTIRL